MIACYSLFHGIPQNHFLRAFVERAIFLVFVEGSSLVLKIDLLRQLYEGQISLL